MKQKRVIDLNYFDISKDSMEDISISNIAGSYGFGSDVRRIDFLEDGTEDLITSNFPIQIGNALDIKLAGSKYNIYDDNIFIGTLKSNTRHKNKYIEYALSFLKPEIINISADIDKLVDKTAQCIEIGFFSITKDILQQYDVEYLDVESWNKVTKIYAIENGLLGKTEDSKFLFCGEVNNISLFIELLDKEIRKNV